MAAAVLFTLSSSAQVSKTKEIHKDFKVQKGVNVEIENKYGKVQVLTWDKDSVVIDIDVRLKSKTQDRLNKAEANIKFDIINTGNYVTAKTVFASDKGALFSEIINIRESSFGPDDETKIDYVVYVPKNCNLTLTNKFGDIYTADLSGRTIIDLSHGDLKAGEYTGGYTKVDVKYGKANINYVQEGNLLAFYATFDIQKAGEISMESKSSEVNIYDVKQLKVDAKRDKYYIKKVSRFTATGSFTDYKIALLTDEIIMDTRYGTITINEIAVSFNYFKLTSKYSDVDVTFNSACNFSFDMEAEGVTFIYPQAKAKLTKKFGQTNQDMFVYTGRFGTGTGTAKVRFNMQSGNLTIKM